MLNKFSIRVVLGLALLGFTSANAAAQATPTGSAIGPLWSGASTSRGSAIAFDPRNKVYLAISTRGTLRGRFISENGVPDTSYGTFIIQSSANYTHFPAVEYSPDADSGNGAFLVIWQESDQANNGTSVHSRMVSVARGGPFGLDRQLVQASSFFEAPLGLAYASQSRRFLAAWGRQNFSAIGGTLIDNNGAALGSPFEFGAVAGGGVGKPGVAYNPVLDQFLVSFSGWDPNPFVKSIIVSSAGVPNPSTETLLGRAAGTYQTDVVYNVDSGYFQVAWFQDPGSVTVGRLVTTSGVPGGSVTTLSTRYSAKDSVDLEYNPATGTSLFVAQDVLTVENGGVEINGAGVPGSAVGFTGLGGTGNFHPKSAANPGRPEWMMVTSFEFRALYGQRISTTSRSTRVSAPGPATLTAPYGTISSVNPTFMWQAVPNATRYTLFVNSTGTRIETVFTAAQAGCASGSTCAITPTVTLNRGSGHWWVLPMNDAGNGGWGAGLAFYVSLPPGVAALGSPSGTSSVTPTFTWKAAANATWYQLWVAEESGNVVLAKWFTASDTGCPAATGACSLNPRLVLTPGAYRFWIQAWNEEGYGAWSTSMAFVAPFAAPSGLGVVLEPVLTYRWARVPGAEWYYVWVTDSSGAVATQRWYTAAGAGCAGSESTCTVTPQDKVMPGTTHYWVQAWSQGAGYSPWSSALQFQRP